MIDEERFSERFDGWRLRAGAALDSLWPSTAGEPTREDGDALRPGAMLVGRYRLESVLGEGAFGRVWRAHDEASDKSVAIKELKALPADEATLADTESQLAQEFFTLSRLRHPNIVAVSDYGEIPGGARYLVMELVPGQDVHERLKHGPLPRKEAFTVLVGLLQALELLHSRLYVHGDIKAENVRVTPQGLVKLMDFGLLHQLGTPATQVQGTVEYMAPEVMQGGVVDARTDLYSVGVLAYEIFTGTLPFEGGTPLEIMRRHLGETPKPPSHFLDLPPALDELVLRLLAKSPDERFQDAGSALAAVARAGGIPLETRPLAHRTSYLYSAHLIGRDEERAELTELRQRLLSGEGARLFIGGRGGEGKTRLLEELRLAVKLERIPWVGGQCRQGGGTPMRPIVDALSALVPRTSDELLAEHGPTLATLLPVVAARGHEPKRPADPGQAKIELYAALTSWLTKLSKEQPFVLCVEDLHWADGATIDILNHLLRTLHDAVVWVLGTFRTNEVDKTSQLYATVHEGISRLLDLKPLTRDHVDELLASTLRRFTPPEPFVSKLYAQSDGNPFFVIETLRWLVESGGLSEKEGSWELTSPPEELPSSIVELVQRRLTHLPEGLLNLCRQLAPVGRVVDVGLAEALSGTERAALFEAFEELVGRQFLIRSKNEIRFAHDTVREGIYTSLDEPERRSTHQRIAELMLHSQDRRREEVEPSELAYHFKRGLEPDRAVPFFFQGAERAIRLDQDLEATKLLLEGVEVLEESPRPDKRDDLVRFYDRLAVISPRALPPATVRSVDRLVEIWSDEVNVSEGLQRLARRERLVERLPPFLRTALHKRRAARSFDPRTRDPLLIVPRMLEHQASQAFNLAVLGASERALQLSEELQRAVPPDRVALQTWCRVARCLASIHTGRTEQAITAAKEAQALVGGVGGGLPPSMQLLEFLAHYTQGITEALAGYPPGEEIEQKTLQLAQRSGKLQDRAFALLPRLVGACLRGTPDEFQRYAAEADDIVQKLSFPQPLTSRLKLWIPVYYFDRQEIELAEAVVEKLEQYAHTSKDSWLKCYGAIYRGRIALERGRVEEANTILDGAVKIARELGLGRVTWALCDRGRALAALGHREEARALVEEAVARVSDGPFRCPYDEIVARRVLGELLTGVAGIAEAERALTIAQATNNPIQQALSLRTLARLTAEAGDEQRSALHATEAEGILRRLRHRTLTSSAALEATVS